MNNKWTMPEWMEKYRDLIVNTGGNDIEELMNDHHTTGFNNVIRAALITAVHSQINFLEILKKNNLLKDE